LLFLADENFPVEITNAIRQAEHDLAWVGDLSPGIADEGVVALAVETGPQFTHSTRISEISHSSMASAFQLEYYCFALGLTVQRTQPAQWLTYWPHLVIGPGISPLLTTTGFVCPDSPNL